MTVATPAQQGIWFTERAGVAGAAYHMAVVAHLDGPLDAAAMATACEAVVARHPALRQAVGDTDGVPRLVPAATAPLRRVPYTDELRARELTHPFDLRRGPLIRFTLASAGPDRHVLLVVAHHLVFDGMSKDILMRELAVAYSAATTGGDATTGGALPDPATVEQERVAAAAPAAREYWTARPLDEGDLLLPGLTGPPDGALAGATVGFDLDPDLAAAVDQAARKLTVTRFELLLSAVYGLLRRYGNPAATVGVDVSTRTADTAGHIGLFVNELPVTVDAPGSVTFAELATAVRGELRAAYRFRAVPVAQAVGRVRPRTALTRLSVSYRRRAGAPEFAGLSSRIEWIQFCGTARNTLHVQIVDEPDGGSVSLQYATAALSADAVERVGAHLRTLLAAAVAAPDTAVADLPVLPSDEWDLLVRRWSGQTVAFPAGATVDGLFRAQARATPHAPAASCAGRRLTYAELDTAVTRLAGSLRERGAGNGQLVATYLPRSLDMLVAVLGVARAGAAFVPIDRSYPAPRRELMLGDADPALVLTTRADAGLFGDRPVLAVDADPAPSAATGPGRPEEGGPKPGDLAYVMYTSGSTGRPNGVAVTHRHLTAFLLAMRAAIDHGPAAVWLGLTSLSFDPCLVELFLPLITGGRVVIVPADAARDPAALVDLVRAEAVTHLQATPTRWRMLLDAGFGATPAVALVGGEALPPSLAGELRARVRSLHNVYGPTETTVWACIAHLPDPPGDITIGRPLPNVRVYLLDDGLRPVPVGLPGELCIGGPGVTNGYLNRPELTAERFVPDPWAPGSALYRTGDLARYLPDGRLVFLGRRDHQIKIRGHRVEPGEIEARLLTHPDVTQAAVVLRGSPDTQDERLVAYTVHRGADPAPAALRDHVARALPAAFVPAAFVAVPALPLTATGKVDRRALPEPPRQPAPAARAPAGGIRLNGSGSAELIRSIWQDVLRIENIGDDEDLFDLGGHSLTITRIMSRIHQRAGVLVPLDAFFDTPTVAEIAGIVDAEVAQRQGER